MHFANAEMPQKLISDAILYPPGRFEWLFRQEVGTEDVVLGMSGVTPASQHCQEMALRIELPGVKSSSGWRCMARGCRRIVRFGF